jgi:hypothetical protein
MTSFLIQEGVQSEFKVLSGLHDIFYDTEKPVVLDDEWYWLAKIKEKRIFAKAKFEAQKELLQHV